VSGRIRLQLKEAEIELLLELLETAAGGRVRPWNSKRISAELARRQIYEVGHTYIDGLFQVCGCARGSVPPRPGPQLRAHSTE